MFEELLQTADAIRVRRDSRKWFRQKAMSLTGVDARRVIGAASKDPRQTTDHINAQSVGKMYLYSYSAKHKDKLPYYDRYPIIFVLKIYKDGWLGMNLHYLPPVLRAKLMDALYTTMNNTRYDDTTKLKISYQIMNASSRFWFFKPTIHRYLHNHVRSRIINIPSNEWDVAMMLPIAKFVNEQGKRAKYINIERVWKDSKRKIVT